MKRKTRKKFRKQSCESNILKESKVNVRQEENLKENLKLRMEKKTVTKFRKENWESNVLHISNMTGNT